MINSNLRLVVSIAKERQSRTQPAGSNPGGTLGLVPHPTWCHFSPSFSLSGSISPPLIAVDQQRVTASTAEPVMLNTRWTCYASGCAT